MIYKLPIRKVVDLLNLIVQCLLFSVVEVNEDSGEVAVTEPRKIRGLGIVDPSPRVLKDAAQLGVPLTCV